MKKNHQPNTSIIKFFDYPDVYLKKSKHFKNIFDDICKKGHFILGPELEKFEKNLSNFTGIKYSVGVANATDGLELLLMSSNIGIGDEVILSSHTMIATASAIKTVGAKPIVVDINNELSIDVRSIKKHITKKTKAIVVTNINGRISDLNEINKISKKYKLKIFEDAAQSLGAKYYKKHSGAITQGAVISFYPAKTLGTFGDGGAILTNKFNLYKRLILLRNHGRNIKNNVLLWGRNSRLDNLHAAFLDYQLSFFKKVISRRREIAKIYDKYLLPNKNIIIPNKFNKDPNRFDTYQNYEILVNKREKLIQFLKNNHIYPSIQWSGFPINHFNKIGLKKILVNTDTIFKKILLLPCNMTIKNNEIKYICKTINNFYDKK